MISLLRKIRHKLLSESNYGIYLLYASGEIFLVVIGILLALQIDNWNQNNKTHKELMSVFQEIREDLVLDTTHISNALIERNHDLQAQTRIIKAIHEDVSFNDQIKSDLGRVMIRRAFPLVSPGFNLLKESELTSIENRVFRSTLIEYYEQVVVDMKQEFQDDNFEFETVWLPYVRNNFKEWHFGDFAIPIDWESIKADHYFSTALQINLNNVKSTIRNLHRGRDSAIHIIEMLDELL
jgi:hypothetical protein